MNLKALGPTRDQLEILLKIGFGPKWWFLRQHLSLAERNLVINYADAFWEGFVRAAGSWPLRPGNCGEWYSVFDLSFLCPIKARWYVGGGKIQKLH